MKKAPWMIAVLFLGWSSGTGAKDISIGTASLHDVYHQVGRSICRLVNARTPDHGIVCLAYPSDGSIQNLKDIRSGRLHLGVAQSDWQFHASRGSGAFKDAGPDESLRALFSVHSEPFTVVARKDSAIETFDDLAGKRVNIGNPGSGQRATMEVVMEAKGWDRSVFSLTNELPAWQQSLALCHDRVQAMVYTVGHPNESVAQATDLCEAVIVEVSGSAIDRLIDEHPFYAYTRVPGGLYPGNPKPIATFGVKATVVASSQLDAEIVYTVVEAVFKNLEKFKATHPAFSKLTVEQMVRDGLSAPFHDGARIYFLEHGLVFD